MNSLNIPLVATHVYHCHQVYCVGMSCSLGKHDDVCEELAREEDLDMTLAYDGLTIGPWFAGVCRHTNMHTLRQLIMLSSFIDLLTSKTETEESRIPD